MCFAGALFPIIAAIPGNGFRINGQAVSHANFWRLGGGPLFVIVGIVFPIAGSAFVKRKSWGRYLLAGFFIVSIIARLIAGEFVPIYKNSLIDFIESLVFISLLVWYLFFKTSVKEYFDHTMESSNQAFDGTA